MGGGLMGDRGFLIADFGLGRSDWWSLIKEAPFNL
jgi:hypothetical protein